MQFSKDATKKLINTAKTVEKQPKNTARLAQKSYAGGGGDRFVLAKLTGRDTFKYSWIQMKYDDTGTLVENPDNVGEASSEETFAIESRNKSESCVIGDLVYLQYNKGYKGFYFDYTPGTRYATLPGTNVISKRDDYGNPGWGYGKILYYDNATNTTIETDELYEINNYFSKAVNSRKVLITWDIRNGRWWIVGADCGVLQ